MAGLAEELGLAVEETAAGIVRVASAEMAQAVRVVTVERGIDPRDLALVRLRRRGPAARRADRGGARDAARAGAAWRSGVLSAFGLVVAERRRDLVESVLLTGDDLTTERIAEAVERLGRPRPRTSSAAEERRGARHLRPALRGPGVRAAGRRRRRGRIPAELRRAFDRAHEDRYGYADPRRELELVTVRVAAAAGRAAAGAGRRRGRAPSGDGDSPCSVRQVERRARGRASCPARRSSSPPGWRARAEADLVVMER